MAGFICAWLVLWGMISPALADESQPLTTILLVARADLADPNFRDTVVLVMNNLGPAPAGLVLNRPTRLPVAHLFPDIAALAGLDARVHFGGPVELGELAFLYRSETPREHSVKVVEGVYLSADLDLLHELLERDKPMDGLRVYIGYSAWAPGQLENEIARGDWTLKAAGAEAIFGGMAEHPWPAPEAPRSTGRASLAPTTVSCGTASAGCHRLAATTR